MICLDFGQDISWIEQIWAPQGDLVVAQKNSQQDIFFEQPWSFLTALWVSVCTVDKWCSPVLFYNPRFITQAAQVQVSNGSSDDERWGIDTGMIYSTVVAGGVHGLHHPGRCLPSHLICILSISVPMMTHTTNEAPTGHESAALTAPLAFHPSLWTCAQLVTRTSTCMEAAFVPSKGHDRY